MTTTTTRMKITFTSETNDVSKMRTCDLLCIAFTGLGNETCSTSSEMAKAIKAKGQTVIISKHPKMFELCGQIM